MAYSGNKRTYLVLALLVLLTGCLTERKASGKMDLYKAKYPAMVAAKAHEWYPVKTIDSITIIERKSFDSSKIFKARMDSLLKIKQHVKDSVAFRYTDTCRSAPDNYGLGFNLGYEVGVYQGKQNCTPDSFLIKTTYTVKDMAELQQLQLLLNETNARMERKTKWLKAFAISAVLGWIIIFLMAWFAYRKKNKIVTDRKD